MSKNVELKVRVRNWSLLVARVVATLNTAPTAIHQRDVYFQATSGRLKLRRSGSDAELIFYERPDSAVRVSEYHRVRVPDPDTLELVLGRAMGIRGAVEKERIAVVSEDTRVHLDRVEGLGQFAEIEILVAEGQPATAARQRARELMIVFELDAADIVSQSYIDLLEAGSV